MRKKPSSKIVVPMEHRPKCVVDGCDDRGDHTGQYDAFCFPKFRQYCSYHHKNGIAQHRGTKTYNDVIAKKAGFDSVIDYHDDRATKKGFDSHQELRNSRHEYRRFRKDYCENIDGRLGFVCTTTIKLQGQLQVDHRLSKGKGGSDDPSNLQTLCACCHVYKTIMEGDNRPSIVSADARAATKAVSVEKMKDDRSKWYVDLNTFLEFEDKPMGDEDKSGDE